MNIFYYKIKKVYLKMLTLKPKIIATIFFIPSLYILGWILASPLKLTNLNNEKVSLIGTIFTFLFFINFLPEWFKVRWGFNDPWRLVGIKKSFINENLIFYFFKGILYAFILLSLILIPIVLSQWGSWQGILSNNIIINTLILIIGVGFAEELIFRGWLLEELKNNFGLNKALIIQALIFSLVHIGFDMPVLEIIRILFGLFLLGILLAYMRFQDNNSIWGCIGLHGGLVGGWFIANNGLIKISKDAPAWLTGPGAINTNPLGGIVGIMLLIILCFFFRYKRKSPKNI